MPAWSIPSQNNISGIWQDLYNDSVGVTLGSNVVVSGGIVTMSACDGSVASSEYTTALIRPSGLSAWGELNLDGIVGASTTVVEARVPGGGAVLVSGSSFPLDLSSIDADINPELEIRVVLTYNAALPCPAVSEIDVSWVPEGTFLVQKSAPATVQADNTLLYTLRLSASNTDIENVVAWDTLPALSDTTVIQSVDYGQDDSPSFVLANLGGTYTATATTVNGVNIPANSVYWELGLIKAGETILFNYTVQAPNGTIDGTEYLNDFVAEASNAETISSNEVSTLVLSAPSPITEKQCSGGAIWDSTTCWILPDSTVTFSVSGENDEGSGRETMLNSVLYDDLTETCAQVSCPSAISNISGGGVFDPAYDPLGSGAFPAIVWTVGTLTPGGSSSQTYQVDMTGVPQNTSFNNTICLDSDRTSPVCTTIPLVTLNDEPRGFVGKDDDVFLFTRYGSTYRYFLSHGNIGSSKLNDVLMFDRIPDDVDFVTASLTSVANGTIFYSTNSTFNDISIPPDYDVGPIDGVAPTDIDVGANIFWSSTPPANPADVTWVAFYVPQISSQFTPPADPITRATGVITVRVKDDGDLCVDKTILNRGLFQINGYTDSADMLVVNANNDLIHDDEITAVEPLIPSINTSASQWTVSPNPLFLDSANEQTILFSISNASNADRAETAVVDLNWGKVNIDGVPQLPTLVNATGGELDLSDISNGNLSIDIGGLAPGESKTVRITFFVNSGVLGVSPTYPVYARITANDGLCGEQVFSTSVTASLASAPSLQVLKDVTPSLLSPGSEFEYTLTYTNHGPGSSTGTYVVDAIPDKTVFLDAQLDNGERLYCSAPPLDAALPSGLTPASPINASLIASSFVLGTDTGGGLWTCPSGEMTTWVAVAVDDLTLSPPQLGVGIGARSIKFNMRNDEDRDTPQVDSIDGTVFFNAPGIFSNELLQAIGNSVLTVVSDEAALEIEKSGPGVVSSGSQFIWTLEYENNSDSDIPTATLTDALPAGMTFISATHSWNDVAITNGAPADPPAGPPMITRSGNDFVIAPAFRGGDLQGREGGTIAMTIQVDGDFATGQLVLNTACANGADNLAVPVPEVCDQDIVELRNPELVLNKLASPTDPRAGDTITYTLVVANLNAVDAPDIELIDTLPAGVTYVPGSTAIVSPVINYSLAEPSVAGQVLSWNAASGNALTHITSGSDVLPGNSGDIIIQYKVTVDAGVGQGVNLLNRAGITTSGSEDGVFPSADCGGPVGPVGFQNEDCTTGTTTPFPDPSISKTGTTVANPGDSASWTITYQNNNNEDALDVYVVDSLPDYGDADTDTDVTFLTTTAESPTGSIAASNIYYNSTAGTAPVFNLVSPTDNGWSNTATPTVNHIAWLVGSLPAESGPFTINVTAQMIDPSSGLDVPPGQSFVNTTFIATSSTDADPTNNDDDHETITPGVDMSVEKTASLEGAVPGIEPGDTIDYTITFTNTGTVTAYGVYIEDTLPAGVNLTADTYTELTMTTASDTSCSAVDAVGDPIVGTVSVERLGSAAIPLWYLGTSSGYQNVGIPVGCSGSFIFTATLDDNIAELISLTNTVRLYTDNRVTDPPLSSPDTDPFDCNELYCDNNEDTTSVTVFLANLSVLKSVQDTATGSVSETGAGNLLTYTIEYNNIGNIDAANTTINEIIPDGTTYVPGSLVAPLDTTVTFNPAADETATDFAISFNEPLPAPATFFGETLTCSSPDNCNLSNATEKIFAGELLLPVDNVTDQYDITYDLRHVASPGDINGDGIEDLLSTAQNSPLTLYFINSDTSVSSSVVIPFPPGVSNWQNVFFAPLGDFDSDGVPDFAVGLPNSGKVFLIMMNINGSVKSYTEISNGVGGLTGGPYGAWGEAIANIGDLDDDGTTDLMVGTTSGELIVLFLNPITSAPNIVKGQNTIDTSAEISPSLSHFNDRDLKGLGDLDGDNIEDVVIGSAGGDIYILFLQLDGSIKNIATIQPGDLSPEPADTSLVGFGSRSATVIPDMDNDGLADLFVRGSYDGSIAFYIITLNSDGSVKESWMLNASSGDFQPFDFSFSFQSGETNFVGDIDNDGLFEVYITSNRNSDDGKLIELDIVLPPSDVLEYPLAVSGNVLNWKSLSVSDEVPAGTSLFYSIGRQVAGVCTYDLGAEFTDFDLGDENFTGLGNLDTSLTEICFKAAFTSDVTRKISPNLSAWRIAYVADENPSFSFQVQVDEPYTGSGEIDNTATISTTTPETSLEDNEDDAEIFINRADLETTKDVDFAAVSLTDVAAGNGELTYTVNYQNIGVDEAIGWSLEDILPSNVGAPISIVASNTSLGNTVDCDYVSGSHSVICSDLNNTIILQEIYASGRNDDQLIVYDTALNELRRVTLTSASQDINRTYGLTIDANTQTTYTIISDGLFSDRILSTVDTTTGEVTEIGTLGVNIRDIAFNTANNVLYGVAGDNNLYEIDTTSAATTLIVDLGTWGLGIAYNPDDGRLYWGGNDGSFAWIDPANPTVSNVLHTEAERLTSLEYIGGGQFLAGVADTFDPSGGFYTIFTTTGENPIVPSLSRPLSKPYGIAFVDLFSIEGSGTLAVGESGTITITVPIDVGTPLGSLLTNNVCIDATTWDTDPTNDCDEATTIIDDIANIYVTKDGPASAVLGDTLVYTLNYGNNGNIDAVDVVLNDILPANCVYDAAAQALTSPAPDSIVGQTLSWTTLGATPGTLAVGETGSLTVACSALDPVLVGTVIENNTVIATTTPELTETDNQDDHENTVMVILASINGSVFHDENSDGIYDAIERPISTVTITLTGTDILGNPVNLTTTTDAFGDYSFVGLYPGVYTITESQPSGLDSTTANVGTGTSTLGSANGMDEITSIVINSGEVGIDYDFGENLTALIVSKVLARESITSDGEAQEGEILGYDVVLDNSTGSVIATYTVTETVPEGTTYAGGDDFEGPSPLCTVGDPAGTTCSIIVVVPAAGPLSLSFNVQVDSPSPDLDNNELVNTVAVTGECPDDVSNDCDETTIVFIPPMPDVVVSKTVDNAQAIAGAELTYTITASNANMTDATAVVLNDVLPTGMVYVSDVPSSGSFDELTGDWTVGTITGNSSETLALTVRLEPQGGVCDVSYENTVSLTSQGEEDADTTNHEDSVSVALVSIGAAKALNAASPIDLGNGSYQVTYDILITNNGGADLQSIQITDDLDSMINTPNINDGSFTVNSLTSPDMSLTANTSYDGSGDTNLLTGSDALAVGDSGRLALTITLTPSLYYGPFMNQVDVSAQTPLGVVISDLSENGTSISNTNSSLSINAVDECIEDSPTPLILAIPSTSITLGRFKAKRLGEQVPRDVRIKWATVSEVANVGFNLWEQDKTGKMKRLNENMIAAVGDSLAVQRYRFIAYGIKGDLLWLSDVGVTGKQTFHGPFKLDKKYGELTKRKAIDWKKINRKSKAKKHLRKIKRKVKQKLRSIERKHKQKLEGKKQGKEKSGKTMKDKNKDVQDKSTDKSKKTIDNPSSKGKQNDKSDEAQPQKTGEEIESEHDEVSGVYEQQHVANNAEKKGLGYWFGVLLGGLITTANADELVSFDIADEGIYQVTHKQLLDQGVDLSGVSVDRIGLKVNHELVAHKIHPDGISEFGQGATILFPAKPLDTMYSGINKYILVLDEGSRLIVEDDSKLPHAASPAYSYLSQAMYGPQNKFSYYSPDEFDSWYADRLLAISKPAEKTISMELIDYAPPQNALLTSTMPKIESELEVNLWGGSALSGNGLTNPDHHVVVELNSKRISDIRFDGLRVHNLKQTLNDPLIAGTNQVTIRLPKDHGYYFDLVNLDKVVLRYPRLFRAFEDKKITFTSNWDYFKVDGFLTPDVVIFREESDGSVFESLNKKINCGITLGDCSIEFSGSHRGEDSYYYLANSDGVMTPQIDALELIEDNELKEAQALIIAHPDFIETDDQSLEIYARELAGIYGGSAIVDVESIYRQYSGHVIDAKAIAAYIKHAHETRDTQHVVLVGGDIYDYRNYLDTEAKSFVPSLYVRIGLNLNAVPSDAKYADIDGDNIPDIQISRLPVREEGELALLMRKRTDYLNRNYGATAVSSADAVDASGYSFKDDAHNSMLGNFKNWKIEPVYIDDLGLNGSRHKLINKVNQGASLVSYFGHSSTNRWSLYGLLSSQNVEALNNFNKPTIVAQWGCWNTFYSDPYVDSLAQRFLFVPGGALTVMGAVSLTAADAELAMAKLLYDRISKGMRLGEAVLSAKRAFAQTHPYQYDVLLSWSVLGPSDMIINQ